MSGHGLPGLDNSGLGRWAYDTGGRLGDHLAKTPFIDDEGSFGFTPVKNPDGTTDEAATAASYLKKAGAYLTTAALPDKAAFAGCGGIAFAVGISGTDLAAPVGGVIGVASGLLRDVLDVVPKGLLGLSFLGAAGYHAIAGLFD